MPIKKQLHRGRFNAILLSGLPGSGKSTAARELSLLLGWPVFSVGGFFREQWQEKYPQAEVAFEKYMEKMTLKEHTVMDKRARKVFEQGHVIGDMHHGVAITKGLPVLQVFISAPLELRAQRAIHTGRFPGKSAKQIIKILSEREMTVLGVAQKIYGKAYDFRDPSGYHVTVNSGLLTVKEKITVVMSFFS